MNNNDTVINDMIINLATTWEPLAFVQDHVNTIIRVVNFPTRLHIPKRAT